jgi:hypothetical protein
MDAVDAPALEKCLNLARDLFRSLIQHANRDISGMLPESNQFIGRATSRALATFISGWSRRGFSSSKHLKYVAR